MSIPVKIKVLPPGPEVVHFQDFTHDEYFKRGEVGVNKPVASSKGLGPAKDIGEIVREDFKDACECLMNDEIKTSYKKSDHMTGYNGLPFPKEDLYACVGPGLSE